MLAFYGTGSTWKRALLGSGAALAAFGVWQNGLEPNGWTRAGIGAMAGYLIGRTVRHFAKLALLAGVVLVALVAVVGFTGMVPADQLAEWKATASDWLASAGDELRGFLLRVAPAGVMTGIGVFAGFRRG